MDEPNVSEVERNAQAFDNAITWIETTRKNFDALEQIVKDVAEVLEIIDLWDFDGALGTIPRRRDLTERDNRIQELQKRAILSAQIAQKESDWAAENQKIDEALNLLIQLQSYVGQPGEIVTKAWIFDETVVKTLPVTKAKVINIVVDYSAKMEALLVGMWKLMADIHPAALPTGSIDLTDFPEILAAEILQDLSILTKDARTRTASPNLLDDPGLDARIKPTDEPPLLEAPPMNPPLPFDPAPSNPPPPSPAPPKVPPTLPPPSLPRPEVPIRPPVPPSPQVTTPPPLPTLAVPIQRNLPFLQGRGRGDKNQSPPRLSHLLRSTIGTGDVPAPPTSQRPTPSVRAQKDPPPPTQIEKSESDLDKSMEGDTNDTGSEFVSESEPDLEPIPAPARKKAPETHSARQPPKAKAASRIQSPTKKGGPSKKARK